MGPGAYKTVKNFGEDTKAMTIQKKRPKQIQKTAGPGQYNWEKSDNLTKARSNSALIGGATKRPNNFV